MITPASATCRSRLAPVFLAIAGALLLHACASPRPAPFTGTRGQVIINRADADWESQQVQEPCILTNPRDPSRLIMFYSGVPRADRSVCAIGKAWALASDPFTWHQDPANPIFLPKGKGWDARTIRLDCVLHVPEEDAYYIYYSGSAGDIQDHIGLAICPVGTDGYSGVTPASITRQGDAPVLAPEAGSPYFETMASQAAVWRERDPGGASGGWLWYMYYSYRGKDGTLPGIRLATSRDGKVWKRQFNANDPRGMGQIFESTPNAYYEWHQISKVGHTYVLTIEVGAGRGERWRTVLAVSDRPDSGWAQLALDTVLQTGWGALYRDDTLFHVATPAFYQIAGKWYLYIQACPLPANRNYIDGQWDLWCVSCDRLIPTRPGLDPLHIPGSP